MALAGRESSHHAWRVETSSLGCNVVLLVTFHTSINAKNIRNYEIRVGGRVQDILNITEEIL